METQSEAAALVESWSANADRWQQAIETGSIASRKLVTDKAIVDAVLASSPRRFLDVGCGEGWLARAIAPHVERAAGFDVSPELIEHARRAGGGVDYHVASYEAFCSAPLSVGSGFDVIAINFALLDPETDKLFAALKNVASENAVLLIQTLHPCQIEGPYEDGWRTEGFTAFGGEAWSPMPWYFRTISSWLELVSRDWQLAGVAEPIHPETKRPASLLLRAVR